MFLPGDSASLAFWEDSLDPKRYIAPFGLPAPFSDGLVLTGISA